jgi:hypothetical protein
MTASVTIPSDYRERKRLWINASLWLFSNERPTVTSSIQNLGCAERILLTLGPLFEKLEWLRIPVAKHELKRVKRKDTVVHYPTHFWNAETGHAGWTIFNPATGASSLLFRTPLADEFLALAAKEPELPLPFAIGGPLGIDED